MTGARRSTLATLGLALLAAGCGERACGGLGGLPPDKAPMIEGPDGRVYHVVDRGPWKAYYDLGGELQRIDYDSNGDGRPDHITHYGGKKNAQLLEVDEDLDGWVDRWEYYDADGHFQKIGRSRRGKTPDMWIFPGPGGVPARIEYDDDGDGRPARAELLLNGRLFRVELDADRDGRWDRWQDWQQGHLLAEELDTDGDGKPDRRLRYDGKGRIVSVETIKP